MIVLILTLISLSDSGTTSKIFDFGDWERPWKIIPCRDGGFAIPCQSGFDHFSNYDYALVKLDSAGYLEWFQRYDRGGIEDLRDCIECADGGFLLSGQARLAAGLWIVRTDSQGATLWNRTFDYIESYYSEIIELPNGEIIVAGSNWNDTQIVFAKFHSNGSLLSTKVIDNAPQSQKVQSVVLCGDNNLMLLGFSIYNTSIPDFDHNYWMMKIDTNGQILWQKTFNKEGDQTFVSGIETKDGGYILVGTWENDVYLYAGDKMHVVRTDSSGNQLWSKNYTGSVKNYELHESLPKEAIIGRDVIECSENGFAFLAAANSFADTPKHVWLVRTDNQGTPLWNYTAITDSSDMPYSIIERPMDNDFIVVSQTENISRVGSSIMLTYIDDEIQSLTTNTPVPGDPLGGLFLLGSVSFCVIVISIYLYDRRNLIFEKKGT